MGNSLRCNLFFTANYADGNMAKFQAVSRPWTPGGPKTKKFKFILWAANPQGLASPRASARVVRHSNTLLDPLDTL